MKSFPKDPVRRALWIQNIPSKNWTPTNNSRLCEVSNHVLFYYDELIITILIKPNLIIDSKIFMLFLQL